MTSRSHPTGDVSSAGRDLIERAALGDREALGRVLAEHRPRARRTALGVLGDPDAAEDVAQEAMIRLQGAVAGFRGDADVRTWIHRIALNLSYDHLRRVRRRRLHVPLAGASQEVDPRASDPHVALDGERARTALGTALDRLPPEQREVLVLRFLSELSYAEIASATDVPEGTVASRICRALRRLGSEVEVKHLEIVK